MLVFAGSVNAPATAQDRTIHPPGADVRPLLNKYCVSCHNAKKARGSLDLGDDVGSKSWKKVLDRVHAWQMPPPTEPQPTPGERRRLQESLETMFAEAMWGDRPDPGPLPPRRLNVREWMNTLPEREPRPALVRARARARKP